ncbi:sensor histidine kinase [Microvirga guangxiensis]|uniref:histidine kinase n=1 Tax=Microvirga guangxiensis TaxID=549386 RepID=A0A1G5LKQ2_9HYPH|nr:ATP-binding protein [Microvirga guangxiensis]SCZ13515.1 Signal transduction histidine kinase [Microvirga guangxiensis]
MSGLAERLGTRRWSATLRTWSLTRQFAVTGSAIMLFAMIVEGVFTAELISKNTIERNGATTALFMNSFLSPLAHHIAAGDVLPAEKQAELDQLLDKDDFEGRFPHLEIWKGDGLVAYSRSPELIGRRFEPPPGLVEALNGEVSARYTDLAAGEHVARGFTVRYLEIYAPIREQHTGRIVGVAEIHEITEPLEQRLWHLRLNSWLARISITALIMAGLFWIVYRGNGIIMAQKRQLGERVAEVERASRHNRILRNRIQHASSRASELNERFLRGLGADLHDGPAQLIGLAALKVEHVRLAGFAQTREMELQALDSLLADALHEIRDISKGLVLPEIEGLPLPEVVRRATRVHEKRTGTTVSLTCEDFPQSLSNAVKMCAYRFVQEGLNNAFRHAGGNDQAVSCKFENGALRLAVEDSGGVDRGRPADRGSGLGLAGLRERVESLGGTFRMSKASTGGTKIEMLLAAAGGDQYE